jgi:hypothetical protein
MLGFCILCIFGSDKYSGVVPGVQPMSSHLITGLYKIRVRAFAQLGVGPSRFSVRDRHLLPAHCFPHPSKVRYSRVTMIAQTPR